MAAATCAECGTPFPILSENEVPAENRAGRDVEGAQRQAPEPQDWPAPPLPELAELDLGFEFSEGFSRPNWGAIRTFIQQRVSAEDRAAAWDFAARTWLHQLSRELGGEARVYDSPRFLCVSDLGSATTQTLLAYAESVLTAIRDRLRTAAWTGCRGRHVLLLFADQEDYYAYISFYHHDGLNPLTGGVFLGRGYAHVALPFVSARSAEHTIVHELVHNLLAHLRLPLWLNEGLAVVIERTTQRQPFLLDQDLVDRHTQHWNERSIQTFWAGTSFELPGDSNELSYRLAEVLVTLLSESRLMRAFRPRRRAPPGLYRIEKAIRGRRSQAMWGRSVARCTSFCRSSSTDCWCAISRSIWAANLRSNPLSLSCSITEIRAVIHEVCRPVSFSTTGTIFLYSAKRP